MDEKETSRVNEFWAERRPMGKAEFVAEFLPHPDIPEQCRADICDFVFRGSEALSSSDQFVKAFNTLKTIGWPCDVTLGNFATISMPRNNKNEFNIKLNDIIAGVTHFEVDQIVWLERRFWERCDRRSQSISEEAFVSSVLSATKRLNVASRVFRLFNEHSNSAIGFKEYVCGLSSLCRGPEAERMKFAVGIWDSDIDGVLSRHDLVELADFFGFSMDLLTNQQAEDVQQQQDADAVHIFDFICWANKSSTVREALLQFSSKIWVALTSSRCSPTLTMSSTATTATTSKADTLSVVEPEEDNLSVGDLNEGHEQLQSPARGRRRLGGVRNIGNTCYLGAAVQTLANVSMLSGFLISNEQQFLHLPLVQRYARMLHSLLVLKETASPVELKESLSSLCTLFADHLQHDSQEFMQFFLDALHESLKTIPSTALSSAVVASPFQQFLPSTCSQFVEEEEGEDEQQRNSAKEMANNCADHQQGKTVAHKDTVWQNANGHWKKEVLCLRRGSIVLDLFAGQFLSMLRCPSCSHSSNTFELFTMLQLQIPFSAIILIPFKVVRRCPTVPIVRYELRVPATTKIGSIKQLICEQIGISDLLIVILNKSGGYYNVTCSQLFNGTTNAVVGNSNAENDRGSSSSTLMDIPFISGIDIWCFETESVDDEADANAGDGGGHLICVHRHIHFKSSFAVLALNGISTFTFGTPIVLTFPSKNNINNNIRTVLPAQLYAMVLEYVQKRYHRNSEKGNYTFNRALDANADSLSTDRNAFPFELSLTRSDATWCYKCNWRRFCRGCPIDANSTESLALDKLLSGHCLLTINWKNISALYLSYNNLAERFVDDQSNAQLLGNMSPWITIDDCLADFTRAERIDGSRCDRCSSKRPSSPTVPLTKQLSFTRLPDILVICFKRFTFVPSLRQFVKQIVPVSFPLDNFDPSKYFSAEVPAELLANFSRYSCIGIVTHHGQLDYGHYCSYVRDFFSDGWFFCNDNKTFPIKGSEVDTRNAYIVFYQRVNTSAADAAYRTPPTK